MLFDFRRVQSNECEDDDMKAIINLSSSPSEGFRTLFTYYFSNQNVLMDGEHGPHLSCPINTHWLPSQET
jgi:hypothetical protein